MFEAARPSEESRRAVAELTQKAPASPSAGVALASGVKPVHLVMARIAGAEWLDAWAAEWRHVSLEISGTDLLDAGSLRARRLDAAWTPPWPRASTATIATRDEELRVALAAAAAT